MSKIIPYLFVPFGWVNYSRSSRLETASIISCCVQINQKHRKQQAQVSTWGWPINYSAGHTNQDLSHFPFFSLVYLKCGNEFLNLEDQQILLLDGTPTRQGIHQNKFFITNELLLIEFTSYAGTISNLKEKRVYLGCYILTFSANFAFVITVWKDLV